MLQLLPFKQAIQYFFVDNPLVEEFVPLEKGATKNSKLTDDDQYATYHRFYALYSLFTSINNVSLIHSAEALPINYAADVHAPPPNMYIV